MSKTRTIVFKSNSHPNGVVKIKICKGCKRGIDNGRERGGYCEKCDTSPAGTWALSWLSELGYIDNDDTIQNGCAYGSSDNNFLGLPNGTEIYCRVDELDKNLFHVTHETVKIQDLEDIDDYDVWWEHPAAGKIDFRLDTIIKIV